MRLSDASRRVVDELGYTQMTPIQAQALPLLLDGDDLVGQAATGSGKTVAFALPMLEKLDIEQRRLQGLVLCPTRELATQVAATIRTLGRHQPGLRVVLLCGGMKGGPQRDALQQGVHIAVGTPGRVQDLIDRGMVVEHLHSVVLDEADRMLDMGFGAEVEKILRALPKTRQTSFFSATFPPSIATMSRNWQRNPVFVQIGDVEATDSTTRQIAYAVSAEGRGAALCTVLRSHAPSSALVFCNFKTSVRAVTSMLVAEGFAADALHGDLDQRDRDLVMAKFRNGSIRVLVATDVAARGLDIDGLAAVVQYEFAGKADTATHRFGRTGRAGAVGLAIALITPADADKVHAFTLAARAAKANATFERLPLPTFSTGPTAAVAAAAAAAPTMATLRISGGRKNKLRPTDLLGALTGEAGLKGSDIGRINIDETFSLVALSLPVLRKLLTQTTTLRIKGKSFRLELLA